MKFTLLGLIITVDAFSSFMANIKPREWYKKMPAIFVVVVVVVLCYWHWRNEVLEHN